MAFQRAAGYGNLPNGVFVPSIYSKKVLKFFRRDSVVEEITNTDYMGEIANFGDTVHIIKEPIITVSPYARGQQLVPQDLTDDEILLTVDQSNAFSFKVDDIEEKQAHLNWQDLATSSAAYALKDTYDKEVLSYMAANVPTANMYGTDASSIAIGLGATADATPLQVLNRLGRILDEQNVPSDNRWVVAPPLFWEKMTDENSKLMGVNFSGDKSSILRNGRILDGQIHGFNLYRSNNMPLSGGNAHTVLLAGHMSSTATASQIAKTEVVRDPTSFADVIRGMHLYGRKVLRTVSLASSAFTVVA